MGGQAFVSISTDSDPVSVPRMALELYERVVANCRPKLESLFFRVTIPREAPGKPDYGDVDFLVEGIRPSATVLRPDIWETVEATLEATLHTSRGSSHSFGLPHPDVTNAYVQVDVEISPGNDTAEAAELFKWTRYMKSDSDLTQIIGICHRQLGITQNDRGLYIRVKEIEPYNRKKSLLFLTRDPNEALDFYGLEKSKYWKGFESEEDLFDWVSTGRFFSREVFDQRTEKSNDRSRKSKRGMFRRFVEDYVPAHPDRGTTNTIPDRQRVLEEALEKFGKHNEYRAMMEEHNQKEAEEGLWRDIGRSLEFLGKSSKSMTIRGLKRWVEFTDGEPNISKRPMVESPIWCKVVSNDAKRCEILEWVKDNYTQVKALEKERALDAKEAAMNSKTDINVPNFSS